MSMPINKIRDRNIRTQTPKNLEKGEREQLIKQQNPSFFIFLHSNSEKGKWRRCRRRRRRRARAEAQAGDALRQQQLINQHFISELVRKPQHPLRIDAALLHGETNHRASAAGSGVVEELLHRRVDFADVAVAQFPAAVELDHQHGVEVLHHGLADGEPHREVPRRVRLAVLVRRRPLLAAVADGDACVDLHLADFAHVFEIARGD